MSVLISYVPTAEGWAALNAGIQEARFRQASVVVVNVALNGNYTDVTFADEKHLDAVAKHLTDAGIEHRIEQVLDSNDIADSILTVAADTDAELIVVALRRRSAVGKALLGSNAQRVILSAQCPVLSLRPDIA